MTIFNLQERGKCPLCGSLELNSLYEINYHASEMQEYLKSAYGQSILFADNSLYQICNCKKCDFTFQNFIPSSDSIDSLYTYIISTEDSFQKSQQSSKASSIHNDALFSLSLKKQPSDRFLDYGAGWGGWSSSISNYNRNTFAFEISPPRVQFIKTISNVEVISSFNENDRFDYINLCQVLEHVVDPLSLLTQLKSLLNPKGIIHISTPNSPNSISLTLDSKTFLKKGPFQPLEHINTFNYKTLNFAATRAGLVPCNSFYVSMKGIYGAKRSIKRKLFGASNWYFTHT